ncbi:hypothetical protein [Haloarchaeobius sp. TZWSO28]|uniref:hypothetical protein n=1 Tax=Haloarchaeobius sp. TZWSO28 TaxID=3446119 RepID=UPI003EB8D99A
MNRRRFLAAAAGGLSATAGCLDALSEDTGPPGGGGTRSETSTAPATVRPTTKVVTSSIGSPASVGDIAATVTAAGVWRRTTRTGTDRSVVAAADRQYLVFHVTTARTEPAATETPAAAQSPTSVSATRTTETPPDATELSLALSLDGVTYTRVFPTDTCENGHGSFAVPVPAGIDASNGAVMWYAPGGTTVRWPLSSGHFDQLDRTPRFVLESFEVGSGDTQLPVRLSVSNQGSRAGRFLAELRTKSATQGESISFGVPLDESVTYHTSAPVPRADHDQATVLLRWGDTVHEQTVDL